MGLRHEINNPDLKPKNSIYPSDISNITPHFTSRKTSDPHKPQQKNETTRFTKDPPRDDHPKAHSLECKLALRCTQTTKIRETRTFAP